MSYNTLYMKADILGQSPSEYLQLLYRRRRKVLKPQKPFDTDRQTINRLSKVLPPANALRRSSHLAANESIRRK